MNFSQFKYKFIQQNIEILFVKLINKKSRYFFEKYLIINLII